MCLTLFYDMHPTQFGNCLIALTDNKICCIAFLPKDTPPREYLIDIWPTAKLIQNKKAIQSVANTMFTASNRFKLHLEGTEFQKTVWAVLQKIPAGTTTSYQVIAQMIGKPNAHRAVATALAKNRIAYLIPCHRVIRKSGQIGKYRWGKAIKKALIAYEQL